jgi:hypothetical protein
MLITEFSKDFTGYDAHGIDYILLPIRDQALFFSEWICDLTLSTAACPLVPVWLGRLLSPAFINWQLVPARYNSFIDFTMLNQLWSHFLRPPST